VGFKSIIDVDEEMQKAGDTSPRREDLQITDQSPVLIVDVKGVGGHPSDDEALQAQKHASIRVQEWQRLDVQGLTIVNHQRGSPPLDRDNGMPFRQEVLDAARIPALGLMTSWDLFRLLRSYTKHGWRPDHVRPIFYRTGRIDIVPTHYQFLGRVVRVWQHAFGIVLENGELRPGDRIAIETPVEFEEQTVDSLKVNDQEVKLGKKGDQTGVAPPFRKAIMREGACVFRVGHEQEAKMTDGS